MFIQAAELEDMDYYAKQCAVRYETTRSNLSRKHDRKDLDATVYPLLNIMLMKEGSPALPVEDTADKKTSIAVHFDIVQPEIQTAVAETEAVNVLTVADSSDTDPDTKKTPETSSQHNVKEKAELHKTGLSKVQLSVTDSDLRHLSIHTEEITLAAVTPKSEVCISGAVKADITKLPEQQSDFEQTHQVPESVPLGQRSNRRKSRDKTQSGHVNIVDSQKLQQTDDGLDFLLSLKKPVKEAKISSFKLSQVTKPTIEDGKLDFHNRGL